MAWSVKRPLTPRVAVMSVVLLLSGPKAVVPFELSVVSSAVVLRGLLNCLYFSVQWCYVVCCCSFELPVFFNAVVLRGLLLFL